MLRVKDLVFGLAGWVKALLAIAFTALLALADFYDAIPFTPLLQLYLGDNAATKLALWVPIVFGVLRYISTNQVSHRHRDMDEGE